MKGEQMIMLWRKMVSSNYQLQFNYNFFIINKKALRAPSECDERKCIL